MKKIIIAAIAKNGVIGRSNGEMAWYCKEDFQHFKSTTIGYPIIMGRKTFESLGKPLKGRLNIIITSNKDYITEFENVTIFNSLDNSFSFCEKNNFEKIFIIGGGEIFKQVIDYVDEMILSFMNFEAEGDIFFPKIHEDDWIQLSVDKRSEFEIVTFVRKRRKKN